MDRYELEQWINKLPLQVLTDDLKEELLEHINDTIDEEILNTH